MREVVKARRNSVACENSLPEQFRELHHQDSGRDSTQSGRYLRPGRWLLGAKLRQHLGQTTDRPGDRDREVNHVDCKFDEGWIKFLAAIEVQ